MEIDRLRYMVSSYLRTRLRKVCLLSYRNHARILKDSVCCAMLQIERFAQYILSDPMLIQRLSQKESQFAKQCVHFRRLASEPQPAHTALSLCRFVVLFENHVTELALGKFADEHRSLNAEGMGT